MNQLHISIVNFHNAHRQYYPLKCLGDHEVIDFLSQGQIVKFWTYIGDTSFINWFTLGYDAYFDCWDWAKGLVCKFYTMEIIGMWVPKIQTKF